MKSEKHFSFLKTGKRLAQCKSCLCIKSARWRKENPIKSSESWKKYLAANRDKINARNRVRYTTDGRWKKQLKNRFSITDVEYYEMLEKQDGRCKICLCVPKIKLDVDHCHKTGRIRGLLCRFCNTALGLFKDSPLLLRSAANYLERTEKRSIGISGENL